mgnify:CR=1 FL=1
MYIVKTTVKGQIVIPAELRKKYHITKGTRVKIIDRNGEIVIQLLLRDPVREAKGIFKGGKSALKALIKGRSEDIER